MQRQKNLPRKMSATCTISLVKLQGTLAPRRERKEVRTTARLIPPLRSIGLPGPCIVGAGLAPALGGLPPPWRGVGQPLVKRFNPRFWSSPRPGMVWGPSLVKSNRAQLAQPALFCYTYTAESICYSGSLSV